MPQLLPRAISDRTTDALVFTASFVSEVFLFVLCCWCVHRREKRKQLATQTLAQAIPNRGGHAEEREMTVFGTHHQPGATVESSPEHLGTVPPQDDLPPARTGLVLSSNDPPASQKDDDQEDGAHPPDRAQGWTPPDETQPRSVI